MIIMIDRGVTNGIVYLPETSIFKIVENIGEVKIYLNKNDNRTDNEVIILDRYNEKDAKQWEIIKASLKNKIL